MKPLFQNKVFLVLLFITGLQSIAVGQFNPPNTPRPDPSRYALPSPEIAQNFTFSEQSRTFLVYEKPLNFSGNNFMRIGNYKVTGSPFLFGVTNAGTLFAKMGKLSDMPMAYNTYDQELEIYLGDKGRIVSVEEIDSFVLKANSTANLNNDVCFVSGLLLDPSKKSFLQVITTGKKFNLYKAYRSVPESLPGDYAKSEERVFALKYDYFYSNSGTKGLKKLKTTSKWLKAEFNANPGIKDIIDSQESNTNQENALEKIFTALNSN